MFSNFPNEIQICDIITLIGLKIEMEFRTSQKKKKNPKSPSKSAFVKIIL